MKLGTLIVLMASSVGVAFAQVTPATGAAVDPWLKAGVAVCSLTALIWVVQYLLRTTIPEQQNVFRETLDKISDKSEKRDEHFREAMHAQTEGCQTIQQRMVDESRKDKQ